MFCRVRPLIATDGNSHPTFISIVNKKEIAIGHPEAAAQRGEFHFDQIFGPSATQLEIFTGISSLAQSVLDGHDAIFFAYGQTCSGKTHTMHGKKKLAIYAID